MLFFLHLNMFYWYEVMRDNIFKLSSDYQEKKTQKEVYPIQSNL